MTPVKYHGGRNYTTDHLSDNDPRNTNPIKIIPHPRLYHRFPARAGLFAPLRTCSVGGVRRPARPLATPISSPLGVFVLPCSRGEPRVMAPGFGEARFPVRWSGSWSCLPSGAVRAGREPRFGRRALGYPPPRARGFCPAAVAPFGRLARPLSLSCCRYVLLSAADSCRRASASRVTFGIAVGSPVEYGLLSSSHLPAQVSFASHVRRGTDPLAVPLCDLAGNYYRLLMHRRLALSILGLDSRRSAGASRVSCFWQAFDACQKAVRTEFLSAAALGRSSVAGSDPSSCPACRSCSHARSAIYNPFSSLSPPALGRMR